MSVYIRRHRDDKAMLELCSMEKKRLIIWAVVHEDMLSSLDDSLHSSLNLDEEDLTLKADI